MLHYSCSTCSIILFFSIVNISAIQVNLLLGNFYNVNFGRHIWKILESTFESRVNHLWRGNLGFSFEFFFCFKSVENMSKSYMYMFSEKLMSLFFTFFLWSSALDLQVLIQIMLCFTNTSHYLSLLNTNSNEFLFLMLWSWNQELERACGLEIQ